jgi:hypothetical protein
MSEKAEKPADDLASESGESEAMETDPGALEEGQRLLDMESPSKRGPEASTPQELAAKILTARNKISKLGRSEISKINIEPDSNYRIRKPPGVQVNPANQNPTKQSAF